MLDTLMIGLLDPYPEYTSLGIAMIQIVGVSEVYTCLTVGHGTRSGTKYIWIPVQSIDDISRPKRHAALAVALPPCRCLRAPHTHVAVTPGRECSPRG